MAKHHGRENHTGPIHHADMHDHLPTVAKDPQIHESHRAGNKEHGGAGHMLPEGEMLDKGQHGGEGMSGNCENC